MKKFLIALMIPVFIFAAAPGSVSASWWYDVTHSDNDDDYYEDPDWGNEDEDSYNEEEEENYN